MFLMCSFTNYWILKELSLDPINKKILKILKIFIDKHAIYTYKSCNHICIKIATNKQYYDSYL